ncbi:MAG: DUF4387 family protein [Acetobacteraceae bacterium]|nr:DUF4387 family protein [Acetobacteraceae bacterium]
MARPVRGNLDDQTLSLIADVPLRGELHGTRRLLDVAVVIRSKDAGINRLTLDIIFSSDYADLGTLAIDRQVFDGAPSYELLNEVTILGLIKLRV